MLKKSGYDRTSLPVNFAKARNSTMIKSEYQKRQKSETLLVKDAEKENEDKSANSHLEKP